MRALASLQAVFTAVFTIWMIAAVSPRRIAEFLVSISDCPDAFALLLKLGQRRPTTILFVALLHEHPIDCLHLA